MLQKELGQNSQHNQLIIHLIYESVPDTYPITVYRTQSGLTEYLVTNLYAGSADITISPDSIYPLNHPLRIRVKANGRQYNIDSIYSNLYFEQTNSETFLPLRYGETTLHLILTGE